MKLNSPWKALLKEELRISGLIVGTILFSLLLVLVFVILLFYLKYGYLTIPILSFNAIDAISFVISAITSFLILLHIGNSGQLQSGFPRQILQLPVPTYLPVAISFFTRLFLIMAQAVIIRLVLLILFNGKAFENISLFNDPLIFLQRVSELYVYNAQPFYFTIFIHGIVYSIFQTISWLIDFSLPLVVVIFLFLSTILIYSSTIDYFKWKDIFEPIIHPVQRILEPIASPIDHFSAYHPVAFFCILILIFYVVNLKIVKGIRHNSQFRGSIARFVFRVLALLRFRKGKSLLFNKFPNRYLAQLWFEMRETHGFILPLWTFLFWILGIGLFLTVHYLSRRLETYTIFGNFSHAEIVYIWVLLPHISLLLSGIMWYLRIMRGVNRKIRWRSGPLSWTPVTNIERVNISILNFSINLILAMLVVFIIQFSIMYVDYKFLSNLPKLALSAVSTNADVYRDFSSSYLWSFVVFVGGNIVITSALVWILNLYPSGIALVCILMLISTITSLLSFSGILNLYDSVFSAIWESIPFIPDFLGRLDYLFTLIILNMYKGYVEGEITVAPLTVLIYFSVCFFLTIMFFIYLFLAAYNRILRSKDVLILLAIYVFVFLCIFPFYYNIDLFPSAVIAMYLALASIITMPWLKSILKSQGLHLLKPIRFMHAVTTPKPGISTSHLLLSHIFAIVISCIVLFVQLYPVINYKRMTTYFKDMGLPANLYELNDWYKDVPDNENLAKKYWDIMDMVRIIYYPLYFPDGEVDYSWIKDKSLIEKIKEHRQFYNSLDIPKNCKDNILDYYPFFDNEKKNDKPFPEFIFRIEENFFNTIGGYISQELKEIANLNLKKSRYPIDLRVGIRVPLPHLSNLRTFTKILAEEAFVFACENKYDEMFQSLGVCLPIYNSLKDEPVVVSQLVRTSLFGTVKGNIEWVINHKELTEPVLVGLKDINQSFLPAKDDEAMFKMAFHHDMLTVLDITTSPFKTLLVIRGYSRHLKYHDTYSYLSELFKEKEALFVMAPIINLIIPRDIEQSAFFLDYLVLTEYYEKVSQAKNVYFPEYKEFMSYFNRSFINGVFIDDWTKIRCFYEFYAQESRIVHAELRHYAYIDLMNTVIAIERFRLAYNRLPENLQELVPDYLPSVPKDPWTPGNDIRFVKGEDESYKVYCVGMDEEDDGGKDNGKPDGDYVIEIASKSKRMQPAISKEVLPECMQKNTERTAKQ